MLIVDYSFITEIVHFIYENIDTVTSFIIVYGVADELVDFGRCNNAFSVVVEIDINKIVASFSHFDSLLTKGYEKVFGQPPFKECANSGSLFDS